MVEMQFLADIRLECEACKGKRFQKEVLDVPFFDSRKDITISTCKEGYYRQMNE